MSQRRRFGFVLIGLIAAAVTVAAGSTFAAQAEANSPADHLVVYDNNIENMLPKDCYGDDFNLLISYIKEQPESPDIFTVQQISNTSQLDAFTKRLSDELPGSYAGEIAIGDPGSMGYTSRCGKLKNQQTNAVIYRSDRFSLQDDTRWRSDAPDNGGPCRNLEPTETSQDRVHNIAVRLHDTVADKDVSVASIHWPTGKWDGPDCAAENMSEANDAFGRLGGGLRILGGDANTTPGTKGWWNDAVDYGFTDPIAELCGTPHCPDEHNTSDKNRIDYLFAKGGSGFGKAATITDKLAGGRYSNHRAVTAYVKY
ncbi:MAG: hypothetical protein ACRD0P_06100 [Stackebrandtia sp.]